MTLKLVAIAVLLGLSAFFSATEVALFSLSRLQLRRLRKEYAYRGQIISDLLDQPRRLLSTVLFGNTIVLIGASILGYELLQTLVPQYADALSVPLMTLLVLLCGEVTPKAVVIQRPDFFAVRLAIPIRILERLTRHVRRVFEALSDKIVQLVEKLPYFSARQVRGSAPTTDEYRTLIGVSERAGIVRTEERHMVNKILTLDKMQVKEVMIPRVDMQCVEESLTPEQMAELLRKFKHRRVPIVRDSPDAVEGILNVKEFLIDPHQDIRHVIEPPNFVPETMSVARLLRIFRRQEHPVAIVVDEYGGTQGMVTLEDILEEIVGEIEDEFDTSETMIQKLDARHFLVNGKARLEMVNEQCGLTLTSPDVETIAGWIIAQSGSIPRDGEEVRSGHVRVIVRKVVKNRIREVLLEIGSD